MKILKRLVIIVCCAIGLSGCLGGKSALTTQTPTAQAQAQENNVPKRAIYIARTSPLVQPASALQADDSDEQRYLQNAIHLLEQAKFLVHTASKQANPDARKMFNVEAFALDIDTIIYATKRYLAASDRAPRRARPSKESVLQGEYIHVKH